MLAGQSLGGTRLTELWFGLTDLSSFSPELLVAAIRSLKKVDFCGTDLTTEQMNAVLTMVVEARQGRLKSIYIYCPDVLDTVSQDLVQAAMKAEELLEINLQDQLVLNL